MSKTQSRAVQVLNETEFKVVITTTEVKEMTVDLSVLRQEKARIQEAMGYAQAKAARQVAELTVELENVEAQIAEAVGLGIKDRVKP